MCFKWKEAIFTLTCSPLKLVVKFIYLGSNISSTESDVNIYLEKAWTAISRLLIIWKFDLSKKIKWDLFQTLARSILVYGCTTWMLTKRIEKRLDGNYTRMLRAVLNKSWKEHPTKQQLFCYLPLISKTTQVRQSRHAGHSSKDPYTWTFQCWPTSKKLYTSLCGHRMWFRIPAGSNKW